MQIDLAKTVAAQPADAFATVANVIDWPQIIESIKWIEVLTPGPIRAGTRLREDRIMFGHDSIQVMQVATIERPHRLRLFVEHPDLHYELDHLIDAIYGGGCRISLIFRSRPETPAGRAVHPFMTPNTLDVPWQKIPVTRRREMLLPTSVPPQQARPIRSETRATLIASIARGRCWLNELVEVTNARSRLPPAR